MRPELLHVVTPVFNPLRFNSRYSLFSKFEQHMLDSGVNLHVIELQFGDRDFAVTPSQLEWPAGRYSHAQLRTRHELWIKENLINLMVARLPADWKYVAWIDADITFRRADWAAEAIQALQRYDVVQLFSHTEDHGPGGFHDHGNMEPGFMYRYHQMLRDGHRPADHPPHGKFKYGGWWGHCGYAWAMRRSAWDKLGGLMDHCILGSADHHMACALVGAVHTSVPKEMSAPYLQLLQEWQDRAETHIVRNVGFVPGTIDHAFHGSKKNRKYVERWSVLKNSAYDPVTDLKRDWQGLYQLTGNKRRLRDDLRVYFAQRNEDANTDQG